MLAIVGTVPLRDFPVVYGRISLQGTHVLIDGMRVDVNRGTPALMAAAIVTSQYLGIENPYGFLAGDIGHGHGSINLYKFFTEHLKEFDIDTLTFHYLQPIARWHDKVLATIDFLNSKPTMIADAGFMYAAKMSGHAQSYDLFTPDIGELAFLADETAPHPFYTRGFILHNETRVEELITRAYANKNAARVLLVKGREDHVVESGRIIQTIGEPLVEALEAIGGTGDTITGIVSALVSSGMSITEAAAKAAVINRIAGLSAKPTPATSVMKIVSHIPGAICDILNLGSSNHGKSRDAE